MVCVTVTVDVLSEMPFGPFKKDSAILVFFTERGPSPLADADPPVVARVVRTPGELLAEAVAFTMPVKSRPGPFTVVVWLDELDASPKPGVYKAPPPPPTLPSPAKAGAVARVRDPKKIVLKRVLIPSLIDELD
jgi:hypothetical protein